MALVYSDQKAKETAWVCVCDQHCVAGGWRSGPVWNPALTLVPGADHAHSAIYGALAVLKKFKNSVRA
jgi:hypothetical protein